jgi:MFS family permease
VSPFGRLLAAYTVNETGDAVGVVALALLVYERTHEVAPTASFFLAAKFLPAFLAPALTARIDQISIRRSLPALYVLEAAAFAALAVLAQHDGFVLGLVLVLALIDGTLAIAGRGLTRGAVASVLQPAGLLAEGNALLNVGFAVASVGGAALAGLLAGTLGLSAALAVDAASFLIIAVLLAATRNIPHVDVPREPFRTRLGAGFRYARDHRGLRLLFLAQAVALVLFTLVVPIEVIYALKSLGTDATGYGVLLASWGAGIVVGSLIYLRVKRRSAFGLVVASTIAIGVSYLGLAAAQTLALACLISIVGGAGNGIQWIAVMTAIQEATPQDFQARITGMIESIGAATPGVGYLLGGAIVAVFSPRVAYAVSGAGVLVLVAIAQAVMLRSRRRRSLTLPPNGQMPLPESATRARPLEGSGSRQGSG